MIIGMWSGYNVSVNKHIGMITAQQKHTYLFWYVCIFWIPPGMCVFSEFHPNGTQGGNVFAGFHSHRNERMHIHIYV